LQWATPSAALGTVGESGLPTWAFWPGAKQGSPYSPPVRGSQAKSGRPAVSGRGRRCQGASPGSKGPDWRHRQRRGSPWRAPNEEPSWWWGIGDGRPKKRCRAPARGLWSGGELKRRSLRWRRSTSLARAGARREGGLGNEGGGRLGAPMGPSVDIGSEAHEGGARWPALGAWSGGGQREAERSG
jgi:hypothetical protein